MPGSTRVLLFAALCCVLIAAENAHGQDFQPGMYAALDVGTIMYSTQITFDGVDDPAGRSGFGYGISGGHFFSRGGIFYGAELGATAATVPDPYTFDSGVTGFSELDLRRSVSAGVDVRVGYAVLGRLLAYGSLGYSINHQSIRIDGTPLDEFAGGSSPKTYGRFQTGAGIELPVSKQVYIRTAFRFLNGFDLDKTDLGTALQTSLNRFDIEPRQWHLFAGLILRPGPILS